MVVGFAASLAVGPSGRLAGQGVLNQFSYDNLRFSGIQADLGVLGASKLTGAMVGGVRVDYGRIAPHVRLLLGLSYFRAQFDQKTRTQFEERIRALVNDPDSNFTVDVGRIFWSDLAGDVDFQLVFPQGNKATAYVGTGVGIHLRNGSGRAINGTFVEDALDEISASLNGMIGVEFHLSSMWRVTLEGRGMLSSGLSTVSLRTGVMYRFRDKEPAPR